MNRQNERLVAAFAIALAELREQAGLTQEQLAERADVSARFISFLENGHRQPSLSALHALSRGMGIRMRDLVDNLERHYDTTDASGRTDVNT